MQVSGRKITFSCAVALCLGYGMAATKTRAQSYSVVGELDPHTGLAVDTSNNIIFGSARAQVVELLSSTGYAKSKIVYTLADGIPATGALTLTNNNVILGATTFGGTYNEGQTFNLGRSTNPNLGTLHSFAGNASSSPPHDGIAPISGLTPGPNNRYYGTTAAGGAEADTFASGLGGIVYEISSSIANPHYTIAHRFTAAGDGYAPTVGQLAVDAEKTLYGMTIAGGAYGEGTIYTLQYVNNAWQEQVIYSFGGPDGITSPAGFNNVALDAVGNVYACGNGGSHGLGAVFKLTPPAQPGDAWTESVLYVFGTNRVDDAWALNGCAVSIDAATGRVVGTTTGGGAERNGTLFALTPLAGGSAWRENIWHNFSGVPHDGESPFEPPIKLGNVFYGGAGTAIYSYTPAPGD